MLCLLTEMSAIRRRRVDLRSVWLSLRWGVRFELWIDLDLVWLSLRRGVRFVRPVDFVSFLLGMWYERRIDSVLARVSLRWGLRSTPWAADWFDFVLVVLKVRNTRVADWNFLFFETRVADWFDFRMGVLTVRALFEQWVDSILVYLSLWWGARLVWQIDLISRWVLTVRWIWFQFWFICAYGEEGDSSAGCNLLIGCIALSETPSGFACGKEHCWIKLG